MPVYNFLEPYNNGHPEVHWELPDISGVSIYIGALKIKIPVLEDSNKKVLFVVDQPNGFYLLDKSYDMFYSYFDLILSIDAYSSRYYNYKYKTNKFQQVPYYIEDKNLPTPNYKDKTISVFYTGHAAFYIDFPLLTMLCNVVKTYIGEESFNTINNYYTYNFYRKMEILRKTKISIVHCSYPNFKYTSDYDDKYIKDEILNTYLPWHKDHPNEYNADTPSLKSRIFEAAISKSIMLCYKDKYCCIEDYYEPNKDFLYFKTEKELYELIDKISLDYQNYIYLSENAYTKTVEKYTTKNLVKLVSNFLT